MFCSNCGRQMIDDAVFCPYCGARVRQMDMSGRQSYMQKDEGMHQEKASDSVQDEAGNQSGYGSQNNYYGQRGNGGQISGSNDRESLEDQWGSQGNNSRNQWNSRNGNVGNHWNGYNGSRSQNGQRGNQNYSNSGSGYGEKYNDSQWRNSSRKRSGIEIASFALGIISIVFLCVVYYKFLYSTVTTFLWILIFTVPVDISMSVLAIVFGVKTKKTKKSGMATGGIVCAIIGLALNIILGGVVLIGYGTMDTVLKNNWETMSEEEMLDRIYDYYYGDGYSGNYGDSNLYYDNDGNLYYSYPDDGGMTNGGGSL